MKRSLIALTASLALPASSAVLSFDLQGLGGSGLLGTNEVPNATGGTGGEILGGITFDDVSKILTVNVGWGSGQGFTDLTGTANAAHLHGPAPQNANGGVLQGFSINDNSADNGFISQSLTLTAPQETALLDGLTYINIHTAANGGGEMRGNLVQVPEPSSAALGLLAGLLFFRRKRA